MRLFIYYIAIILIQLSLGTDGLAQESVRIALWKDLKRADYYFNESNYSDALEIYLVVRDRGKGGDDIDLKIARSYAHLNECDSAATWYGIYEEKVNELSLQDQMAYAEMLSCAGNYEKAITYYQLIDKSGALENQAGLKGKIWQLSNLHYLYEDTSNYIVKPLSINTEKPEFGAVFYQQGIVFSSHKDQSGGIKNLNGVDNTPFFTTYFSRIDVDSNGTNLQYNHLGRQEFAAGLSSRYHTGTVAFFPGQQRMVYARNLIENGRETKGTLGLYFAEYNGKEWTNEEAFPYNSEAYSISNPSLNDEGTTLYFVSDMTGGYGGKDIYRTEFIDGRWQTPENLGPLINTPNDEIFPFYHNRFKTLYFSSNGHSGFGGFDVFKIRFDQHETTEVINPGSPINSSYDDFGIVLNPAGTHGYISSNRINGGADDDIFSLQIDRQTYPITVKGNLRLKDPRVREATSLSILAETKLELIDLATMEIVDVDHTDQLGRFRIEVPHASQYIVRATDSQGNAMDASFEVPKNMQVFEQYQIVMVPDLFKDQGSEPR